jgi:hypothetical protein
MLKSKISLWLLIFLSFGFSKCSSLQVSEELRNSETIKYLRENGYDVSNATSSKKDAIANSLTQSRTVYKPGDYSKICSLSQIKYIQFEKTELPSLTSKEIGTCSQMAPERLGIVDVKMSRDTFCTIADTFKKSLKEFDVAASGLTDEMMPCIANFPKINFLIIGRGAKISKEVFCKTLGSLPTLTFIRIEDTDLPKSSLQCILEIPNLTNIWLRSWANANYEDREALIKAYERKYKRKIEFNLYD